MALVSYSTQAFSLPNWIAEELAPEWLMPGGSRVVPAQFPAEDSQTITLAAGAVAVGTARTLTLTAALQFDIPIGTVLDFGGGKIATLTNGATRNTTSITGVTIAGTGIAGGESIVWAGVSPRKPIISGQLVGRTFAERTSGIGFGPADVATPDDEIYLIAFGCVDANINPDITLLRNNALVYEDRLPGWATVSAGVRTAIRSRYRCVTSV